jgi:hypothetical protein
VINESMDALVWLRKQLETGDNDLLREMVRSFAEGLMGAEADAMCGAPYGQASPERANRRNGYRSRRWSSTDEVLDPWCSFLLGFLRASWIGTLSLRCHLRFAAPIRHIVTGSCNHRAGVVRSCALVCPSIGGSANGRCKCPPRASQSTDSRPIRTEKHELEGF